METIKEFFKHINVRLSSPLIFSFVISWLIWNWEIPIGLLLFNKQIGFESFKALVIETISKQNSFSYPLIAATIYTVSSPFINMLVRALQTYFEKWSEDWNLYILKDGKIGIDKYVALRTNLNERKNILEKVINEESATVKILEDTRTENLKLKQDFTSLQAEFHATDDMLRNQIPIRIPEILQGKWNVEFTINGKVTVESIRINGNQMLTVRNGAERYDADLLHFNYTPNNNIVTFLKVFTAQNIQEFNRNVNAVFNELRYDNYDGTLTGTENINVRIKYTRVIS